MPRRPHYGAPGVGVTIGRQDAIVLTGIEPIPAAKFHNERFDVSARRLLNLLTHRHM
ncbi:hypothetical protein [Mycobacterium sp. URHB0044]|uniref:hypothetical protein n=1 Tax=Mycobacterium sp. URHB0044 TaxID=1380386 RepID=UPI0012DC47CB|nr:hypothetical protein [Mycobacterium sp. URHB0044]